MSVFLNNHLSGAWQAGTDQHAANTLRDPVTGEELATTGGQAQGLVAGFDFARTQGATALQAMTYGERAAMLGEIGKVLIANRDASKEWHEHKTRRGMAGPPERKVVAIFVNDDQHAEREEKRQHRRDHAAISVIN